MENIDEYWNIGVVLTERFILVGGSNHLEKYESQWEGLSHTLWKIKNVPHHQPGYMENVNVNVGILK